VASFSINIATYVTLAYIHLIATHVVRYKVNNPLAHELTTAPEIIAAVTSTPSTPADPSSGKVDVFVGGAGTGGTVSGVAKGIKKAHNRDCVVVGVDPVRRPRPFPPELAHLRSRRLVPFSPSPLLSMRRAKAIHTSLRGSAMTLRRTCLHESLV